MVLNNINDYNIIISKKYYPIRKMKNEI